MPLKYWKIYQNWQGNPSPCPQATESVRAWNWFLTGFRFPNTGVGTTNDWRQAFGNWYVTSGIWCFLKECATG